MTCRNGHHAPSRLDWRGFRSCSECRRERTVRAAQRRSDDPGAFSPRPTPLSMLRVQLAGYGEPLSVPRLDAFVVKHQVELSPRHPCVLKLIGKRHKPNAWYCDCQRIVGPLWDHPRLWTQGRRAVLLTLEPYDCEPGDVEAARKACAPLGLEVTWSKDESFWCPGYTTLVVIRRAGGAV